MRKPIYKFIVTLLIFNGLIVLALLYSIYQKTPIHWLWKVSIDGAIILLNLGNIKKIFFEKGDVKVGVETK